MHKLYGATLAAIFAATSVGSVLVTNAQNPSGSAHGWLASGASVALADDGGDNQGENDNDDRGENNNVRNHQDQAHNCYNPAGHQRGRCKHGDDNNRNNNNDNNNGNNNGQQSLRGVITSLNGNSVTLMQGLLSSVTVNDQRALDAGRANNLYVGRTVTAYGYWNNGTFYATNIN